jgi:tRNA pseudouridine38-40 synthase
MESGLQRIMGRPVRVIAAGRTDAGVHAEGQVVHLRAFWSHSMDDLRRAWNANLPRDIAIRVVAPVAPGFHARFSARSRVYRYRIYVAPVRSPLRDRYSWHVRHALDVAKMDVACRELLGRHDLASFGPAPQGEDTVRTVLAAACVARDAIVSIRVEADAFLQHMMRRLTATLVALGAGRLSLEEYRAIVAARDTRGTPGLAPPSGLCLVGVRYDPKDLRWPLPPAELWQKESC